MTSSQFAQSRSIGFIGLGVMGEPICRNLASKAGATVLALDKDAAPLQRLAAQGVKAAASAHEVAASVDVLFLSLPSGEIVDEVCRGSEGILANARPGLMVVDLSTTSVDVTRRLAADFARQGMVFIDAPVARTRAAAEAGTLSVMVGATPEQFEQVRPLIATFASDIALCGAAGCGQVVKILNNMVLFEIVAALSEAKAIGERSGVAAGTLFDVLSKGSADSFALRNHGMKAMVPDEFPLRAFSVDYARKDLRYALKLASECGVDAQGARHVDTLFQRAIEAGGKDRYWPVIGRLFQAGGGA